MLPKGPKREMTWGSPDPDYQPVGADDGQDKKRRKFLNFAEEVENELAVWYKDNELLYNKSLRAYKDVQKKQRVYEEKAASVDPPCTGNDLKVWIDSMRTRYGRLTDPGKAPTEMSVREKWIVETFDFLGNHIVRVPNRQVKKKISKGPRPSTSLGESALPDQDSSEDDDMDMMSNHTQSSNAEKSKVPKKTSTCSRPSRTDDEQTPHDEALAKFIKRAEATADLQQHVDDFLRPAYPRREVAQQWTGYLSTQLEEIHPALWDSYVADSLNMLFRYKAESQKLYQIESFRPTAMMSAGQQPPQVFAPQNYTSAKIARSAASTHYQHSKDYDTDDENYVKSDSDF